MTEEDAAPDIAEHIDEIKTQIIELKAGLMEIATQVGRLKGELKAHVNERDAHNPGAMSKRNELN